MNRHALEHFLWKIIKKELSPDFFAEKGTPCILVGLSGGVDSLALLNALIRTLGAGRVAAAYFHHGLGADKAQQDYRSRANLFCQSWCEERGVVFHSNGGKYSSLDLQWEKQEGPSSEAELREARYQFFNELKAKHSYSVLALGHHLDDLLETRMLRLIRGTGLQGLLAMQVWDGFIFRPFLEVPKLQLQDYLRDCGLSFLEDPSNLELDPFRNWVRQEWFPLLEKRSPGALERLGHSLQNIVEESQLLEKQAPMPGHLSKTPEFDVEEGIHRNYFLSLSKSEKLRLLAKYLRAKNYTNFGRAHLEEVCKRLDNSQKELNFRVARLNWIVNAAQIKVES